MTKEEKINELLTRGVEDIFVKESLEKKLNSGQKLRVKLGFDPTGSKIHIGRAIVLRKLKAFQNLGHQIVFLVGDFTAMVGDPSDKLEKRPMLSMEKIEENLKDYKNQVSKIIDIEKAEFRFNSEWLSNLKFEEISELAESFSVGQMLARRNFKERMDKNQEISLRELLYPLMQGYDSVALKADIEIGGFDQLFNLKAGRIIQKHYGQLEQDVLTTQMLEGTDGRKMSTSWGNVINITDDESDMYGKVMSIKDELIEKYFLLCTELPIPEIKEIMEKVKAGGNPKDAKMRLGREIVALYYNKEKAAKAESDFNETFKKGGVPEDVLTVETKIGELLSDLLIKNSLVKSKSEWRRLVGEEAVVEMESGQKISDPEFKISKNAVFKIGKRRFLKVEIT